MVVEVFVVAEPLFKRNTTAFEVGVGFEGVLVEEPNLVEYQRLVIERGFRMRESDILVEGRNILVLSRPLLEYIVWRNRIANYIAVAD